MKFKKTFIFFVLFALSFAVLACDKETTDTTFLTSSSDTTTTTESTSDVQQLLSAAANMVIISSADSVVAGFTVPAEIGIATVSWSSNNPDVVQVAEYATELDGALRFEITVNRPTEAEGDTTVTLTGVFTYGTETYSKDYTLRVRATTDASGVNTIAEAIAIGTGQYVTYLGMTIVEIVPKYGDDAYSGFFFTDGTDIMYYHDKGYTGNTIMSQVTVGSVYDITGEFSYYYGAPQLSDNGDNLVTATASSKAAATLPYVDGTVTSALEGRSLPSETSPMEYTLYHLTAKVYVDTALGDYGVFLVPADYDTSVQLDLTKTDAIRVYYKSDMDVIASFQNQVITIDFILYSYHSSHGDWYGYFYGTANDVNATSLSDSEQLALYVSQIESSYAVVSEFTLPAISKGTYSDITISSELTSYLTYSEGTFSVVRPEGTDVTGTLTVTVHVGDLNQDVSTSITIRATGGTVGSDLYISEYIEGSSYNKYLEIYNPTSEAIDLSEYSLVQYNNGSTTVSYTLALSGTLAPGATFVIANSQAVAYTGTIDLVTTNNLMGFNGDDVIVLLHGDTVVDAFGMVGNAKDNKYAENVTLVRKSSITAGDTDPFDTFTIADEWDTYTQDDVTHLGSHTVE